MYKISIQIKKHWSTNNDLSGLSYVGISMTIPGGTPLDNQQACWGIIFCCKTLPRALELECICVLRQKPKVLPRGFANGLPTGWSAIIIHNAWFNLTCYHAPSPGHTPWDLQFFFSLYGLFPIPGHAKRVNSLLLGSWSTSYTIFGVHLLRGILISIQWQNLAFLELL